MNGKWGFKSDKSCPGPKKCRAEVLEVRGSVLSVVIAPQPGHADREEMHVTKTYIHDAMEPHTDALLRVSS